MGDQQQQKRAEAERIRLAQEEARRQQQKASHDEAKGKK